MKEIEVVVGIKDNPEVEEMGKQTKARGGLADCYSRWLEPKLKEQKPEVVHIKGANTVSCVPNLGRFVVESHHATAIFHLPNIRTGNDDTGDNNNLQTRYEEIIAHLPDQGKDPRYQFVPKRF